MAEPDDLGDDDDRPPAELVELHQLNELNDLPDVDDDTVERE